MNDTMNKSDFEKNKAFWNAESPQKSQGGSINESEAGGQTRPETSTQSETANGVRQSGA
jgi:hypothetical protein